MSEDFTLCWTSLDVATRDGLQELNLDWKTCKSSACTFETRLFKVSSREMRGLWQSEIIMPGGYVGLSPF